MQCCDEDGIKFPKIFAKNSEICVPIKLEPGDDLGKDSSGIQRECLNFVRSVSAPALDCGFGPREQSNQITHWIDASNIYGSNEEVTEKLRLKEGGLLNFTLDINGKEQLPIDDELDCEDVEGE